MLLTGELIIITVFGINYINYKLASIFYSNYFTASIYTAFFVTIQQ